MHDELPAPPTTAEPSGTRTDEDDRDREGSDCDEDDPEEDPLAYRLERLRLWRTLVTLAVVVARLIRSL